MKDIDPHIKIKIILSLKKLLSSSKENRPINDDNEAMADSYEKIGRNAQIRKATVSNTFTGESSPKSETLIAIIKGMGFNLMDFAKVYEKITDLEIDNYIKKNAITF